LYIWILKLARAKGRWSPSAACHDPPGRRRTKCPEVASDALDGAAIDLPEGVLAGILSELVNLDGRLDLAVDRLAEALDPVGCGR
jgi:hypothetical protein